MTLEQITPVIAMLAMASAIFCYGSYQMGLRHEREHWIEWLRRQR